MKKKGHPDYQDVLFIDTSTGTKFVCGTTLKPEESEVFQGKRYPVYRVPISSASHPFFTGSQQFLDTEGRVDKFRKRYGKKDGGSNQGEQKSEKVGKKPVSKKKVEGKKK